VKKSYVSDGDVLLLEDETGRVKLVGSSVDISSLITGIPLSIKGKELHGVIVFC
jgi:DNA helicase TIP49 (TBP-interacting protein)